MESAATAALLGLMFVGTHIGLASSPIRTRLVGRLGPIGFSMLFSAVAATTFAVFVHYYATVRFEGASGLDLGRFPALRAAAIGTIVTGVVLVAGSLWRFPASTLALLSPRPFEPRGIERITRHPFFFGLGLIAVAHTLLATRLVGTVVFAEIAFLTLAGAAFQDRKLLADVGEPYAAYLRQTSFVPFVAVLSGRQQIVWHELPLPGLAVGVALAFALRWVHPSIMSHGGLWVIAAVLGGAGVGTVQTIGSRVRHSRTRREIPAAVR